MKIFLDDVREEPIGWQRTFTAQETIELLSNQEITVSEISLDHDLGNDEEYGTGMDVVRWIEKETFLNPLYTPPLIHIHSANPVGIRNMKAGIDSINRIIQQRQD